MLSILLLRFQKQALKKVKHMYVPFGCMPINSLPAGALPNQEIGGI
jgi:hypothetical protein